MTDLLIRPPTTPCHVSEAVGDLLQRHDQSNFAYFPGDDEYDFCTLLPPYFDIAAEAPLVYMPQVHDQGTSNSSTHWAPSQTFVDILTVLSKVHFDLGRVRDSPSFKSDPVPVNNALKDLHEVFETITFLCETSQIGIGCASLMLRKTSASTPPGFTPSPTSPSWPFSLP